MKRSEMLLVILGEEASEITQEVSKCLRFGPEEIYEPIGISNADRIMAEFCDLTAMMTMLLEEGVLPKWDEKKLDEHYLAKRAKVEKMLEYSRKCGRLE